MSTTNKFNDLSVQQQFALLSASLRLHYLANEFDFHKERRNASYADIDLEWIIFVIDGFLSEPENLPSGNLQNIKNLRVTFTTLIIPSYEVGKTSADDWWASASNEEKNTSSIQDRYEIVELGAPQEFTFSQKNWYMEGYCKRYQELWMQWMIDSQGIW